MDESWAIPRFLDWCLFLSKVTNFINCLFLGWASGMWNFSWKMTTLLCKWDKLTILWLFHILEECSLNNSSWLLSNIINSGWSAGRIETWIHHTIISIVNIQELRRSTSIELSLILIYQNVYKLDQIYAVLLVLF